MKKKIASLKKKSPFFKKREISGAKHKKFDF